MAFGMEQKMGIDVSSAGGSLVITTLRLLHIVGGLVWVGAAMLMSLYIEPTAEKAGADGTRFLRALYRSSNIARMIPAAAAVTTVAGLLLYEMLGYSRALGSGMGIVLTAGSAFGLLAFLHGLFAVWRPAGKYAGQLNADADDDGALAQLEDKLRRNGRASMWLAVISLILMAGARYISPLLG